MAVKRADIKDEEIIREALAWRREARRTSIEDRFKAWSENRLEESGHPGVLEAMIARHPDAPPKVVLRAIERSLDKGLLEYGTSVRFAWPTDKGLDLIGER